MVFSTSAPGPPQRTTPYKTAFVSRQRFTAPLPTGRQACLPVGRFDRGLIGVDADYRVWVHGGIAEEGDSPYSLRQFEGRRILLPREEKWWTNKEGLAWRMPN